LTIPSHEDVAALRWQLHSNGYKPVAVYSRGKRPFGNAWQDRARQNPSGAVTEAVNDAALSTGILCDGLRAIDVDIDDPTIASEVERIAYGILGTCPARRRADSARALLLYRAASGEPCKRTIEGTMGNVEALGHGQQFVAFGTHEQGQEYTWAVSPAPYSVDALTAITEEALTAFLGAVASLIGSQAVQPAPVAPTGVMAAPVDPALVTDGDRALAQGALQDECTKLRKKTQHRNNALNSAANNLGEFIGSGALDEQEVIQKLYGASVMNGYEAKDGNAAVMKTIYSGLTSGKAKPRPLLAQRLQPLNPVLVSHLEEKGREAATRAAAQIQTTIPSTQAPTAAIADIEAIQSVFAYRSAPIEFAVHNIIAYSAITLISGDAGCGKTTLITAMASHIANGATFLGHTSTQLRRVLYLDRENSLPIVQERLRRLRVTDGANLKYFGAHVGEVAMPGSPIVKEWVQRTEPKPVVFVDSLSAFMDGNENSTEDIRRFMQQLRDLATLGAAVVILHHVGKGENAQEYRGSSDIKAAIDVGFILRNFGETRLSKLALKPFKARFTVTDTMALSYEHGEFTSENAPQASDDGLTELLRGNPGLKKSEFETLALKHGFKRSHIRSFIDNGVQAGLIRSMTGLNNAQRIVLAQSTPTGMLV